MKKVMFLMAVAGMFAFAACNNNAPVEEPVDSTTLEEVMPEEKIADTTVAEVAAEEAAEVVAE